MYKSSGFSTIFINMKITSPFFFLILVTLSCKNDHIWNEESNTVHREVKNMLHNYYKDINENGLLAELKYFDRSTDFSWLPPGFENPISYDTAATIIRKNALVITSAKLTWDTLIVTPMTHDSARYTGKITSIVVDSSGFTDTLVLSEEGIVVRRKDGWKLLAGKTVRVNNQ